jgi:5-methylcytosine-specific restriction endonuclease McrA
MNIRNQLAGTEEKIPKKRIVVQIYICLSFEYDSLIEVITYGPQKNQILDNIINTLMEEKKRKTNKIVTNNTSNHLYLDQHL